MSSDANDKTWEEILSVTILNRTWRLDAAARAFPHGHEDEDLMKARWTIGLYLELQKLRNSLGDAVICGFMTTELTQNIAERLSWFDYRYIKPTIHWELLPRGDSQVPAIPCAPWMFGFLPNYIEAKDMWWEDIEETAKKPDWWTDPDPKIWLFQVSIPRDLLGRQVTLIADMVKVLDGHNRVQQSLEADVDWSKVEFEDIEY